jgi:GNAT superfamily N-acetyltransferase
MMASTMQAPNTESRVALRAANVSDEAFLREVYATTRREEMAMVGWSEEEKGAFLRMQFDAQARHYRTHFEHARFDVIEVEGEAAGRLYVDRTTEEIRVLDITLLPQYRGRGIGGTLLGGLIKEANRTRSRVTVHVEQFNPARRLYERLGFVALGDVNGMYLLMQWLPDSTESCPNRAKEATACS